MRRQWVFGIRHLVTRLNKHFRGIAVAEWEQKDAVATLELCTREPVIPEPVLMIAPIPCDQCQFDGDCEFQRDRRECNVLVISVYPENGGSEDE